MRRCGLPLLAMGVLIIVGCDALRLPEVEQPKPATTAPQRSVVSKPPPAPDPASSSSLPRLAGVDRLTEGNAAGDELSNSLTDNLRELEHVLAVVKDEASARRASARIKSIIRRQMELRKAILDLAGTLSVDEDTRLKARHGEQIESAARRVIVELQRIKELPGAKPALIAIVDSSNDSS